MERSILRALYIGRFQPFHLGHLKAVSYIMNRMSELIIVIGSAQYSHTVDNPFTTGERISMIRLALNKAGINPSKYYLIPVPDTHIHSIWVAHVQSYVPFFNLVYTNNPLARRLFIESGFNVELVPFYKREIYSATEIRKRILERKVWENLVPVEVARFIKEIGGIKRLQDLFQKKSAIKTDT